MPNISECASSSSAVRIAAQSGSIPDGAK
jgi:hypothetical protein